MRAVFVLGVLLLQSALGFAANHPLVQLEIDPCVDVLGNDVRRLIAIELGAVLSAPDAPGAADRTRVAVSCAGTFFELRVDDPITGKSLERTIDLQEAPSARSRLLALAIVELISTSWTELETNPKPKVPPVGPRASPESQHAALKTILKQSERSSFTRLRLLALGGGRAFFSGPKLLGGGGLRLAGDHAHRIGWMADIEENHGNAAATLGSVSVDTLSFGSALVFYQAWSKVALHLGAGLRGGAVRLSGNPNAAQMAVGKSGWGPWLGPMGVISMSVAAMRRLVFDIGIDGGYAVLSSGGLVAGVRKVAVDGPFIGFQLGMGFFL